MKAKPLFIVISAPSGCGKTTLIDMLLQEYSDIVYSISCTTRAPRGEEEDGVDYHFKTVERFEELIAEDAFIEHAPTTGGEDFSIYTDYAPGAFLFMGIANEACNAVYANHHGKFTVDESALLTASMVYAQVAMDFNSQM